MGSRKFQSVLTGSVAVVLLIAGSASASAPDSASGLPANLACSVALMGVASASVAQVTPSATQGCVLPVVDQVAPVPVAEPAAVGLPQRAAGIPRGLIIAGAVASGLAIYFASRSSNSSMRFSVSA